MLVLSLTAELLGVTELMPNDTKENPFYFTFRVQCTSCRETHPNWVGVNRFDTNDLSGSRGEANFVWRCKSCKVCLEPRPPGDQDCHSIFTYLDGQRESSASIKSGPVAYKSTSPPMRQKILEMDCRGLEFVEFRPDGEWTAKGEESGTSFTGIDLNEEGGEWFEYDDKASDEVSIKDCVWEIRRS